MVYTNAQLLWYSEPDNLWCVCVEDETLFLMSSRSSSLETNSIELKIKTLAQWVESSQFVGDYLFR